MPRKDKTNSASSDVSTDKQEDDDVNSSTTLTTFVGLVTRSQRREEFLILTGIRIGPDELDNIFDWMLEQNNWDVQAAIADYKNSKVVDKSIPDVHSTTSIVNMDTEEPDNPPLGSATSVTTEATNTTKPVKLSQTQKNIRLHEFKLLAGAQVTSQTDLRNYLAANEWHVVNAYSNYRADRAAIVRGRHKRHCETLNNGETAGLIGDGPVQLQVDGISSESNESESLNLLGVGGSLVPFSNNVEQERRDSARAFYVALKKNLDDENDARLSASEALLLLLLSQWDIAIAIREFCDNGPEAARQQLSNAFDHMRTQDANDVEKDERLATLIQVTERTDILSLVEHLERHQWDLVAAIVTWHSSGIQVSKNKKALKDRWRRKDHDGVARPVPHEEETKAEDADFDLWADEPNEFVQGGSQSTPERLCQSADSNLESDEVEVESSKKTRQLGFGIDQDHKTIQAGVPKWCKMIFEYVQRGKLRTNIFRNRKYGWVSPTDLPSDPAIRNAPRFDWTDANDVNRLNSWRRQAQRRSICLLKRPASQPFTQEMNDFLYQLSESYVQKLISDPLNPRKREDVIPFRAPEAVKKEWQQLFNDRFKATTPGGHSETFQERSVEALMTQRTRYAKLCTDFKVSKAPPRIRTNWTERQRIEAERQEEERRQSQVKRRISQPSDSVLSKKLRRSDEEVKES